MRRRLRACARALLGAALLLGAGLAAAVAAPSPTEPPGSAQPIDLATALRLAGANNLELALVRTAEQQAAAANDAATLRFVPSLTLGQSFARRTGADQQTAGSMLEVDKTLYRRGAAVGLSLELGDALFGKLAARQLQIAAAHDVRAQRNDTLLAAAEAYFTLVDAVAERDIAAEAVQISQQYQSELERAVHIGLTNRSEALRVAVQTQQAQFTLRGAQALVRTAAASLDTVLRLDPTLVLTPAEHLVVPPMLVSLDTPLTQLVETALRARPELKASAAAVSAAERERTGARYGPLIPSLGAMAVYGQARGGPGGLLEPYRASHDYAVGLSWRFGPGGLFDFSRTEAAEARLARQRVFGEQLRERITQQVVTALTGARTAEAQMHLAREAVELARHSLQLTLQRREFGVYAVTEVIQAQQDFTRARSSYAQALARYAKSQYALARAIGRIG